MNKKTILFTIELKDRELVSKCLLSMEMAKSGFRVYIGSFRAIDEIKNKIKSCVFFHKSTYQKRMQEYKTKMGAIIAILDEEAGIAIPPPMIESFCHHRYQTVTPKNYDYIFTIGNFYTNKLQSMPNINGVHVVTSGWPRIDLWREEYSSIYNSDIEDIRQKHGNYWLFVSSFGFTSKDGYEFQKGKAKDDDTKRAYDNVFAALQNYIHLLKELATDSSKTIIVRPHTSESIDAWKALFIDYPNVLVIRDGDITPWLLAASGVITYRSTVNIQAALNGIPTVQYKINDLDGANELAVFKVSKLANSIQEVREYLLEFENNDTYKKALKEKAIKLLEGNIESLTGKLATQKIAEVLSSIPIQPQSEIKITHWDKTLSYGWNKLKFFEYKLEKALSKKKREQMSRFEKIKNGITASEITDIINKLNSATPEQPSYSFSCTQESNNLVKIELMDQSVQFGSNIT